MKTNSFKRSWLALIAVYTATGAMAHEQDAEHPIDLLHEFSQNEAHLHTSLDSRYVSEGRDNLDGDSLLAAGADFSLKHFAAGVWYGNSPNQSYDELQLSMALVQTLGEFDFYVAYTHLRTPFDNAYDNEVGAGVAWGGLPWELELGVDGYYSFDAEGSFWTFAINREFELTECLSVSGSANLGVNAGYISDGHNGWNDVALRAEAQYALTDKLSLNAHVSYSWALNQDSSLEGDEFLTDFAHVGVGLQWIF